MSNMSHQFLNMNARGRSSRRGGRARNAASACLAFLLDAGHLISLGKAAVTSAGGA